MPNLLLKTCMYGILLTAGHIHCCCRRCRYCIAIMADTEGSEIHTGELQEAIKVEVSPICTDITQYKPSSNEPLA
jgi:hypothetical protein